ncbi:MAG: hypothetical protein ACTTJ6_07975 [Treponema sp.]
MYIVDFMVKTLNSEKIFRLDENICMDENRFGTFIEMFLSDDTEVVHKGKSGKLKTFLD